MGKARLPDVETREQAGLVDLPFLALSILLTALGLVMIFSASYARALYETGDSAYFFKRQLMFAIVGVAAMLVISRMRPELLRKLAFPVLGVSILFLLLVFVPASASRKTAPPAGSGWDFPSSPRRSQSWA